MEFIRLVDYNTGMNPTPLPTVVGMSILTLGLMTGPASGEQTPSLELIGIVVTPHIQSDAMRWRRPPDPELAARVELVLQNRSNQPLRLEPTTPIRFDDRTATELVEDGQWAWHSTPAARPDVTTLLPAGAATVWNFNGRSVQWGVDTNHRLDVRLPDGDVSTEFTLTTPQAWISAVTFLGTERRVEPTELILHICNQTNTPLSIRRCRLWLPHGRESFLTLSPQQNLTDQKTFPTDGVIPAGGKGGLQAKTGPLPLTYALVQVELMDSQQQLTSLWAHVRIKREMFDISGGWVASDLSGQSSLTAEPYLKTLKRMHINTAHIGEVAGYTDNPARYEQYPLKLFNRLTPVDRFDRDEMLARIHAVEFLGEPQYGGGRPVPPQEVWQAFQPYETTRLPTTVTHSEERIWRYYAGLSDYPHYDAYRVCAPRPMHGRATNAGAKQDCAGGRR